MNRTDRTSERRIALLFLGLAACTGSNDAISAHESCTGSACTPEVDAGGGAGGGGGSGGESAIGGAGGSGGGAGGSGGGAGGSGGAGGAGGAGGSGGGAGGSGGAGGAGGGAGGAGGAGGNAGGAGGSGGGAGGAGGAGGSGGGAGGAGGAGGVPEPSDAPPRAVADGPETVRPGARVLLDGSRSFDPEGLPLTYLWVQTDGPAVDVEVVGESQAAFTAPPGRTALTFGLTVTDAADQTDTAAFIVHVGNTAPVADAGPDQPDVRPGSWVGLDGSASRDADDDAITFTWQQIGGPAVALDDALSPTPSFVAPEGAASLVFELAVSDGLATSSDWVAVHVDNRPPVVDAGADRLVAPGAAVTLAGLAEDPDGDALVLQWRQVEGLPVELDDVARADPSFLAPDRRTALTFELTATDGTGVSAPDRVTVLVDDVPPTADAGPDQLDVEPGAEIALAGQGEDLDGDPLTWRWSQTAGPAVALSDVRAQRPTFTAPDRRAELTFALVVDDGVARSRPDTVRVTVRNTPPSADAGSDRAADHAEVVRLDGSGSADADGDPLRWSWMQTAGAPVVLDGADGPFPVFTAPRLRGPLTFRLVVSDDAGPGIPDEVVVSVRNGPPRADAGIDFEVDGLGLVTLDGTRSADPDGDALGYFWQQVEGTPVQLDGRNTARPTFRAPEPRQRLRFELVVNDGAVESAPDEVIVDIRNHAPVANAGQNVTVDLDRNVTLNGSGMDLDGDPLTYTWRQLRGRQIQLSDLHDPRATFRSPNADTEIELELVVDDGFVRSAPDTVTIRVNND
jgi:hypothetical protein